MLKHTGSSLEPCELCSVEERREPIPRGGFCLTGSERVLSVHLSRVCVCVGGAGLTHETPAAVRYVIFYTCLGANVDSVTD